MTKPKLYEEVAIARNIPEENLKQGDVAVVVEYVPHPAGGEEGAILEIFNAIGESVAVFTVSISAIKSLHADQVLMVRERTPASEPHWLSENPQTPARPH